jgi:hypothetical protein
LQVDGVSSVAQQQEPAAAAGCTGIAFAAQQQLAVACMLVLRLL